MVVTFEALPLRELDIGRADLGNRGSCPFLIVFIIVHSFQYPPGQFICSSFDFLASLYWVLDMVNSCGEVLLNAVNWSDKWYLEGLTCEDIQIFHRF